MIGVATTYNDFVSQMLNLESMCDEIEWMVSFTENIKT